MTADSDRSLMLMQLLQMSDSQFPVGTFSFSNGLETASHEHLVHDADTLRQYVEAVSRQAAFTDGVAAIRAREAALAGDLDSLVEIDKALMLCKLNDETRLMLLRMGKKMAELTVKLLPGEKLAADWLAAINDGRSPGSYPVAQGLSAALRGIGEEALYTSHQFGVINMVLSAALRCVRVSHYDTQAILQELAASVGPFYEEARSMGTDDMHSFAPEADIFASLHEKGQMRMFMN